VNSSEKTDAIAPALVAALGKVKNPHVDSKARVKTKQGYEYEYKYLSLPALCEHIRAAFDHVGLAFSQEVIDVQGGTGVVTRIWHLSGQWVELGPLVLRGGATAQEQGSLTTYARRYALAAAVGLAADEDDDGAKASRRRDSEPTATRTSHLGGGSDHAGTGAPNTPPASVPAPHSPGEAGAAPGETTVESGGLGEAPDSTVATPEQRERLLAVYHKRPSMAKQKAVEMFDRFEKIGDVLISDLTSSEVEELILAAAS